MMLLGDRLSDELESVVEAYARYRVRVRVRVRVEAYARYTLGYS